MSISDNLVQVIPELLPGDVCRSEVGVRIVFFFVCCLCYGLRVCVRIIEYPVYVMS